MEGFVYALAAIGGLAVLGLLLLAIWLVLAGDTEQEMLDEAPTLDVQNHIGD